jgi:hypothetical protein
VSGEGAFEKRMGLRAISDAEAEGLLGAGSNGGDPDFRIGETAAFLRMARTALLEQPAPEAEADLVRRLAETARLSAASATRKSARSSWPIRRSRRRLVAKLAVAAAVVPAALAGLAFAGVSLPDPANSAFESLGVELPNQASDDDDDQGQGGNGAPPSQQTAPGGASASQGNSEAAHQHALDQRRKARGKAIGHERGKAIGLNELEPPGHTGDTGPPEHSNAGGSPSSESAPGRVTRISPPRTRGRGAGVSRGQGAGLTK